MPMLLGHVGLAVFNVPLALCFTGHPSLPHSHGSRVLPHDCWLSARLTQRTEAHAEDTNWLTARLTQDTNWLTASLI